MKKSWFIALIVGLLSQVSFATEDIPRFSCTVNRSYQLLVYDIYDVIGGDVRRRVGVRLLSRYLWNEPQEVVALYFNDVNGRAPFIVDDGLINEGSAYILGSDLGTTPWGSRGHVLVRIQKTVDENGQPYFRGYVDTELASLFPGDFPTDDIRGVDTGGYLLDTVCQELQ